MQSLHVVVDQSTQHCRLFWWSLEIVDVWKGGNTKYLERYEYGTTLPHYIFTMLFWMPLAIVSSIGTYLAIFLFLFVYPIEIKSLLEYLGFLAALCMSFGAYQILRSTFVRQLEKADDRSHWKKHFPGGFVLLRKAVAGIVEGVIPIVTFVGEKR